MIMNVLMMRRIIKRGLSGSIFLLVGLFIFEFVQPLVANSLGGGEGIATLFERLPPAFQAVMKTQPEFIALSGLAGYLSLGFSHPIYFVLTSTVLLALITRSLAGELESGTVQIALSRSVSRSSIYVSRLLAVAIAILSISVITFSGMVAGILIGNPDGEIIYSHLIPTAISASFLLWAIAGVTLAISAWSNTTSQAVGYATGFLVVSFVLDYLAGLWSVIEPFDFVSIYSYFDPATALVNGDLSASDLIVLGSVGTIGVIAGLLIFRNRDLPT
jgi:ABC-2 type transport system permease protein